MTTVSRERRERHIKHSCGGLKLNVSIAYSRDDASGEPPAGIRCEHKQMEVKDGDEKSSGSRPESHVKPAVAEIHNAGTGDSRFPRLPRARVGTGHNLILFFASFVVSHTPAWELAVCVAIGQG